MKSHLIRSMTGVTCLLVGAMIASATLAAPTATASVSHVVTGVRGFNGTTIKVAGLETVSTEAGAQIGAEALFKHFNETNEIPGLKIQYVTTGDDGGDPATALSTVRQLVDSDQVFAIVPDLSGLNPAAYETENHVLHVGWGIDDTYCSAKSSTSIWGFAFQGCQLEPPNEKVVPDNYLGAYKYVSAKTGLKHPAVVILGNDTNVGKNNTITLASQLTGDGFNVVSDNANLPTVVSDYTPYIEQWMAANGGKQPDLLACGLGAQCIAIWADMEAAGYTGTMVDPFGNLAVVEKLMKGTIGATFYNSAPSQALTQMQNEIDSFAPNTALNPDGNVPAYLGADMFISALKTVAKKYGVAGITDNRVQHALATQTWSIPGLAGPAAYPQSSVNSTPACSEFLYDTGTGYQIVSPFSCDYKTFKLSSKFTGGAQTLK